MQDDFQSLRQPPHNLEAEQALLGAILVNNDAYERVVGVVRPEEFFDPLHRQIFETAGKLIVAGRLAGPITLKPFFADAEPIDGQLTVPQYLGRLAANAATIINAADYARTIRDLATRRQVILLGEDLVNAAFSAPVDFPVREQIEEAQSRLSSLADVGGSRRTYTAVEAGGTALAHLDTTDRNYPTTGLVDLDRMTGGWPLGQLSILAARPGMGKSALAVSALLRAGKAGVHADMFSLEMQREQLGARMLTDLAFTNASPINYEDVLRRNIDMLQRKRLEDAAATLMDLPLRIEEQRGLTMADITARMRKRANALARANKKLEVVFVDHILLVRASNRYAGNRNREVGEIADQLATIAKELDVAVIGLCQLNRGVEGRDNKRPGLADLRDSGELEEHASLVGFLYRPAYYVERDKEDDPEKEAARLDRLKKSKHILDISIAKNRNGRVGHVEAFVDIGANAIRNKSFMH